MSAVYEKRRSGSVQARADLAAPSSSNSSDRRPQTAASWRPPRSPSHDVEQARLDLYADYAESTEPYPYLSHLQASFGHALNLADVRAHMGAEASQRCRELGTPAFTHGGAVWFDGHPTLDQAAHEAAHAAGVEDEATANVIAHRAASGKSVNHLLPSVGQQRTGDSAVYKYTKVEGAPYDRLSDDGQLAVGDHTRNAWATPAKIDEANKALEGHGSIVKVEPLAENIQVTAPSGPPGGAVALTKFHIVHRWKGGELGLVNDCGGAAQEILGADKYSPAFVASSRRQDVDEYTDPVPYVGGDSAPGGTLSTTEQLSSQIYRRIFEREFGKKLARTEALVEWSNLPREQQLALSEKYGINAYAAPNTGQAITIGTEPDMPVSHRNHGTFNFHFGYCLTRSGEDYITLENYAKSGKSLYFDMYGPPSKKQAWGQDPSNVGLVDHGYTAMVVGHPESLNGAVNSNEAKLFGNPSPSADAVPLLRGMHVTILQKGAQWMKVKVTSAEHSGKIGWMLNQFYTDI